MPLDGSWMDQMPTAQAGIPPSGSPPPAPSPTAGSADTAWMNAMPAAGPPDMTPGGNGVFANLGAGTSEGTANFLGMPVDLATGAINLATRGAFASGRAFNNLVGASPVGPAPQINNPVGGSDFWKTAFGGIGADPRTVVAANEAERTARGAGQGLAGMLLPWAGARALPALSGVAGAVQEGLGGGGAPTMAAAGVTGGAAGQLAADSVPDPYKGVANVAGNLVGGALPIAASALGHAAWNALAPTVSHFVQPFTQAGRQAMAGSKIANAATDLPAVHEALDNPAAPLVPGSLPTTFQLTGDQGLGVLDRQAQIQLPDEFLGRSADQNIARVGAVAGLTPPGASPEAIGNAFRSHLNNLDTLAESEMLPRVASAQFATNELGGRVPVGQDAQLSVLQGMGAPLRAGLNANDLAAKAQVARLSDAIDPEGTLAVDMAPLKTGAAEIAAAIPKNAAPMEGDAGKMLGLFAMQPKVQTFAEVAALRSRLTTAMRTEYQANGSSPAYRTLTQLLGKMDDTLTGSVADQVAAERTSGIAAAGNGIEQRLTAEMQRGPNPSGAGGGGDAVVPGGGAVAAPVGGGVAASVPHPAGPGVAGSDPGLAAVMSVRPETEPRLTPNFDADAMARYRARNAAHAERLATFQEAPGVGQVLATNSRRGDWKLGDSQVAATIFKAGPDAAERVQAFLKAGGNAPGLASDLGDYAAFSLRRAAETPGGILDPAKAAKWMQDHSEALAALPELRARFQNAATASSAIAEASGRHLAAREAFEKSAASNFLGDADPVVRMGRILRSENGVATMRDLVRLAADKPNALAGMRAAVVDDILGNLRSNSVAGPNAERTFKSDVFQTYIRKAAPALRELFPADQVDQMAKIAADLQRSNRSITGTKIPGGSNTPQDLAAGHGGKPSVLGLLVAAETAGEAVHTMVGPWGRVAGMVGTAVGNAMRMHGLEKVDDLVAQAMLHPEIARALLAKVPRGQFSESVIKNAARQIGTLTATSTLRGPQDADK